MADAASSTTASSKSELPTEMELCSRAIYACSTILNAREPQNVEELEGMWQEIKQEVMRDFLLLWSGENNPQSKLNAFTSSLLKREGPEKMRDAYTGLLESRTQHFGEENCPRLFRSESSIIGHQQLTEYLLNITQWNDAPIPFSQIQLHHISSVYDEILDYTPTFLEEPRKWTASRGLPVLKKTEDTEDADLKQGEVGLLRFHSRDNDASERDKKGAFYTPYNIAHDIVKRSLSPLVIGKSREEILQLKVCDPALGSGVFLLAASDYLSEEYRNIQQEEGENPDRGNENNSKAYCRYLILDNCVYGVDIDQTALDVAEGILTCAYQDGSLPTVDFAGQLKLGNSMLGVPIQQWVTIPDVAHADTGKRKSAKNENESAYEFEIFENLLVLKRLNNKITGKKKALDEIPSSESGNKNLFGEKPEEIAQELNRFEQQRKNILKIINSVQRDIPNNNGLHPKLLNFNDYPIGIAKDFLDTHLSTWWQKEMNSKNDLTTAAVETYLRFLLSKHDIDEGELYTSLNQPGQMNPPPHYDEMLSESQSLSLTHNFFHWELEFHEIFLGPDANGGFDAIIGNPPWGIGFDSVQQRRFEWAFPLSGDKESAWALLEMAMRLVRPNEGRIGYIIPNTFLLNISSEMLRGEILQHWTIEEILDYSNVAIFEGAGVRACQIHIRNVESEVDAEFTLHRPDVAAPEDGGLQINQSTMHQRSHWGSPEIELDIDIENFTTIGDCCLVRQGYKPYVKGKFTARGWPEEEVTRVISERPYHHKEQAEGRILQLYGKDVNHFHIKMEDNDERWVDHVEDKVAELMPDKYTSGPKIMVREIAGKSPHLIIAAHTELKFVHDPGVIMVRPKEGLEQLYDIIELYLNSSVCENHIMYYSAKVGKGLFAKFTLGDIKQLPLPQMENITAEILEEASVLITELRKDAKASEDALKKADDFVASLYNSCEGEGE